MRICRRGLAISWLFFTVYVVALMLLSYLLGTRPYVMGLPRWVAIGNVILPGAFVIVLILVVEKLIPDFPLSDGEEKTEDEP